MSDLIKKEDAINEVCEMVKDCFDADAEIIDAIKTTINEIPPAETEWIPCSKRLPSEYGEYFVTAYCKLIDHKIMRLCYFYGTGWSGIPVGYEVKAWRSKPIPYSEDGEE